MPKPYIPNDKWSKRAASEGYRARSVYKLMELQDRFRLLRKGMTVVDLGAAPGSWLQYAGQVVGSTGRVIGIDLQDIQPVADNVHTHRCDMTDTAALRRILHDEGVTMADTVLCDAAPNTSGIHEVDRARSAELGRAAFATARELLRQGGWVAVKIFRGEDYENLLKDVKRDWVDVHVFTATASRDRSSEVYVVARRS